MSGTLVLCCRLLQHLQHPFSTQPFLPHTRVHRVKRDRLRRWHPLSKHRWQEGGEALLQACLPLGSPSWEQRDPPWELQACGPPCRCPQACREDPREGCRPLASGPPWVSPCWTRLPQKAANPTSKLVLQVSCPALGARRLNNILAGAKGTNWDEPAMSVASHGASFNGLRFAAAKTAQGDCQHLDGFVSTCCSVCTCDVHVTGDAAERCLPSVK